MLKGKTAVVTGGSRGIGEAIVCKLASLGADVAVIYAGSAERAATVCERCRQEFGVRAESYCCDVSDFDAVKETVAAVKAVHPYEEPVINATPLLSTGLGE